MITRTHRYPGLFAALGFLCGLSGYPALPLAGIVLLFGLAAVAGYCLQRRPPLGTVLGLGVAVCLLALLADIAADPQGAKQAFLRGWKAGGEAGCEAGAAKARQDLPQR